MALFEPPSSRAGEEFLGTDVATRALSVTVVENDFVERVYENIAWAYDLVFGPTLHPGRVQAIQRMGIAPGDRVLEVGVGTGINAGLYPRDCSVTGIDLSASMLEKARERSPAKASATCGCSRWTPPNLKFADDTFDIVYAPYVISVVPDPVAVVREMHRVCRPGGRIIVLNHFRSANPALAWIERAISPFTVHVGFKSDLDLPAFLAQADLQSRLDRESEHPADLVAHHLRQRIVVGLDQAGRTRHSGPHYSVQIRSARRPQPRRRARLFGRRRLREQRVEPCARHRPASRSSCGMKRQRSTRGISATNTSYSTNRPREV